MNSLETHGNYDLEKALAAITSSAGVPATVGNVYVVMNASDPGYVPFVNANQKTYSNGTQMIQTSLLAAYNATTTNQHDVILVNAYGAHAQTAMLTVSKSRVHFVGMDLRSGYGMGARSRITMGVTSAATDIAIIKNTGVGNTFTGLKFDSSNTVTESIYAVVEAGEYAVWDRCEFYKSTDLDVNLAAEVLNNGDSTQWLNCVFGSSANIVADNCIRPNMLLSATIDGAKCRDNIVKDCIFLSKAGGTEKVMIYGANATDVERMFYVKDCLFYNSILSAATPAHAVGFGAAQTEGAVILKNCTSVDCTVMAQASVAIYVDGAVPTFATTGVSKAS